MKYEFTDHANATIRPIFDPEQLKPGMIRLTPSEQPTFQIGLGPEDELRTAGIRKAYFSLPAELLKYDIDKVFLEGLTNPEMMVAAYEGLWLGNYTFTRYKADPQADRKLSTVCLEPMLGLEDRLAESHILMESADFTRYLVNSPAIDLYPETLAQLAKDELEPLGVDVSVYGRAKAEELGLSAFLSVAEGSHKEPQVIIAKYQGGGDEPFCALIGKGLTYDSGGYGIKTTEGMVTMHGDMAGSATVLGAIRAIAAAQLPKNVYAVVLACENMIDGSAYKNGDIISSHRGKTIEIISTDAEGRLTLADALSYTEDQLKPAWMVDVATLTGAVVIALGDVAAGAVGNDPDLMQAVLSASQTTDEPIWELPNFDEYKEQYKSTFADLKNTGGRGAGTITAGLFLGEFVQTTPWVHLDVAGVTYRRDKPKPPYPAGASGFGVKTLYQLVKTR